jgi:hypothetical protein
MAGMITIVMPNMAAPTVADIRSLLDKAKCDPELCIPNPVLGRGREYDPIQSDSKNGRHWRQSG